MEWHTLDARDERAWSALLDDDAPIIHAALDAQSSEPGEAYAEVARAAIANARGTHRRLVFASAHDAWPLSGSPWLAATRQAERDARQAHVNFASPRFGLIHGEDRALKEAAARTLRLTGRADPGDTRWHGALIPTRVERAAMCVLRCALEPDRRGALDIALARYIGDAVMWQ